MTAAIAAGSCTPSRIGPYRVLSEIGRGGMGVVYRAVRNDGGPEVALKMPNEDLAHLFGLMRREIHALGRLRHPGIVRIVDEGVARGVPWYAMELLDSVATLAGVLGIVSTDESSGAGATDILPPFAPLEVREWPYPSGATPEGRPDLQRALTLMYRLARVLAYVHGHGIVHRDLKPENVLVRPGDRPVLVDFGLMGQFRARGGRETLEIGGLAVGTALYMSPEQASGRLVDARADLYSFGAMLYEFATGRPPFSGAYPSDIIMRHVTERPVPPSLRVRNVPPALDRLILNLLEKRPADRIGYAEDVAELLVEAGAEPDPDFKVETAAYLYRPEIVGRKQILDSLCSHLPAVCSDRGRFVMLGGVSGIGKTSVAAAFTREATLARLEVIGAECDPVGGQPLHPLQPLLRQIADHCRADPESFDRILGQRIQVLRDYEPVLAALAPEYGPSIPPEIAGRRLFSDLAETLAAFARERPLALVLDDLQWADELTLRFLHSLDGSFFEGIPLMILGTYRTDETGPQLRALLSHDPIIHLLLDRLDDANVAEVVRSMLAAPDAHLDFLQFLAAQTEGNPFFVAEYLRAAVDERMLFRKQGRWQVVAAASSYATLGLPGTVRDLVAYRLERLSPAARRLAEAAAVLGRDVHHPLLVATSGETERDALEAMTELLERHIFEWRDDGIRFTHDKLREGAYAGIAPDRNRVLHARAADAIEKSCGNEGELTQHAAELARHWDLAGQNDKAIACYDLAGGHARQTCAYHESVELLTRALELDQPRPAREPPQERALRQARRYRIQSQAHYHIGDLKRSSETARRSLAEAGVLLPTSVSGWRMRLLKEIIEQAAHLVLPRRLLRARQTRQPELTEIALAAHCFSAGNFYEAEKSMMLATSLLAVNSAERCEDASIVSRTYVILGMVAGVSGLHGLAGRYLEEGRRLAAAKNDLQVLSYFGVVASAHHNMTCNWERCSQHAEEAFVAAREAHDDAMVEVATSARGFYEFYAGYIVKAERTYELLRASAHKRDAIQHEGWGLNGRARSLILMDRIDEALECLGRARVLAGQAADRITQLTTSALTAYGLLHGGKLDAAIEAADTTWAMAEEAESIMYEMFRGLSAPAEVYLAACSRVNCLAPAERKRLRRAAETSLRRLRALAKRMPLALPVSLRLTGVAASLDGNPRRGEKLLRRSMDAAERLALPIDEGVAAYELARVVADPGESSLYRERARAIFRTIGCSLYLKRMEREGA